MLDQQRHGPVEVVRGQPASPAGASAAPQGGGALRQAAKAVAAAGVGGDTMVVHVNADEFNQMRQIFGDPTINPNTGLPQFSFLGDWGGVLAGGAGSLLGIGSTIGDALGSATGLFDPGTATANAIGSALLGTGVGALTGGTKGALTGALTGGLAPYLVSGLEGGGNGSVTNLLGGLLGGGGGSAASGASGAANAASSAASAGSSAGSAASSGGGLFAKGGALPYVIGGLLLANTVGQMANAGKPSAAAQAAAAQNAASNAQFNQHLPTATFNRQQVVLPASAYYRYGYGPGQNFFTNNQLGTSSNGYAQGGPVASPGAPMPRRAASPRGALQSAARRPAPPPGAVRGPGDGRADIIPARLSNGEYVVDAETTSLLGNGSSDAGAAALDQMRANVRKHKGGALSQGKFSPDAKAPEQYMRGGRA